MLRWTLTGILAITLTNSAAAFGPIGLGLPLLFSPDVPFTGIRTDRPVDGPPLIEFQFVAGSDEAQEPSTPLNRTELARECVKAWRMLVAEGRYDLAPAVAAKAAAYDPTNLDARHAVVVSHVLRDMNAEECRKTTTFAVGTKPEAAAMNPTCDSVSPKFDTTSIDDDIVKVSLKNMFPNGLLGTKPATPNIPIAEPAPKTADEHRALAVQTCDSAPQCKSNPQTPCGMPASIRQVSTTLPAVAAKRITVNAAGWQIECDRTAHLSERELVLEGNVILSMRGRNVTVQAGRVRVDLEHGTIDINVRD